MAVAGPVVAALVLTALVLTAVGATGLAAAMAGMLWRVLLAVPVAFGGAEAATAGVASPAVGLSLIPI